MVLLKICFPTMMTDSCISNSNKHPAGLHLKEKTQKKTSKRTHDDATGIERASIFSNEIFEHAVDLLIVSAVELSKIKERKKNACGQATKVMRTL